MDMSRLLRLYPTLELVREELSHRGWRCEGFFSGPDRAFRNVRLFTGRQELEPDILYALRPGESHFPTDLFAYVSTEMIPGEANHLCCPGISDEELLDALMELFSRFQRQEHRIDQLTFRGGSLEELCDLGAELLENPVLIHDDWFIFIAMSRRSQEVMTPESITASFRGYVPRVILDDFKYDSDYLETYAHPDARVWDPMDGTPKSLYVNLWDGAVYRGRLLVIQHNRPFRRSDFILAEVLTQRAIQLLHRKQEAEQPRFRSMDDTVLSLLDGRSADPGDLNHMLTSLSWSASDSFLCVRIRSQKQERNTVMEHLLHSDLFRLFPSCYILFQGREQCLLLNQDRTPAFPAQLRHKLALLCRDYYLYAGVSSSVRGVSELRQAYYQAGVSLDHAFALRSDRWVILFRDCALEHVMHRLPSPLTAEQLIAPELEILLRHDRENGTQYFETFREYLLQERDIPRTSQKLIIHRTTLLYRLKKIESMISVNLEDPWQRLYLVFSLWILSREENTAPVGAL